MTKTQPFATLAPGELAAVSGAGVRETLGDSLACTRLMVLGASSSKNPFPFLPACVEAEGEMGRILDRQHQAVGKRTD